MTETLRLSEDTPTGEEIRILDEWWIMRTRRRTDPEYDLASVANMLRFTLCRLSKLEAQGEKVVR